MHAEHCLQQRLCLGETGIDDASKRRFIGYPVVKRRLESGGCLSKNRTGGQEGRQEERGSARCHESLDNEKADLAIRDPSRRRRPVLAPASRCPEPCGTSRRAAAE